MRIENCCCCFPEVLSCANEKRVWKEKGEWAVEICVISYFEPRWKGKTNYFFEVRALLLNCSPTLRMRTHMRAFQNICDPLLLPLRPLHTRRQIWISIEFYLANLLCNWCLYKGISDQLPLENCGLWWPRINAVCDFEECCFSQSRAKKCLLVKSM